MAPLGDPAGHELLLWSARVLDAAVAGTVLLAAAGTIGWLLRDGSAAARHLTWALALSGLLLLPAVSPQLPGWELSPVPSAERFVERRSPVAGTGSPDGTAGPGTATGARDASGPAGMEAARDPGRPAGSGLPAGTVPGRQLEVGETGAVGGEDGGAGHPVALLALLWLAGTLAVLSGLVIGKLRIWWLGRRAVPVRSRGWRQTLDRLSRRYGVRRPVRLLRSSRPLVPMTWGLLRPRILLPAPSSRWSEETRRNVLLHELAHVKRLDSLTQLMARLTCAIFWFHPLVWYATGRLRLAREEACDDLVLRSGTLPSEYAGQLVRLARGVRAARVPVLGSGAVGGSDFGERMRALLDPRRGREPVSGAARVGGSLLAGCLVVALALLRPAETPGASAEVSPAAGDAPAARTASAASSVTLRPVDVPTPSRDGGESGPSAGTAGDFASEPRGREGRPAPRARRAREDGEGLPAARDRDRATDRRESPPLRRPAGTGDASPSAESGARAAADSVAADAGASPEVAEATPWAAEVHGTPLLDEKSPPAGARGARGTADAPELQPVLPGPVPDGEGMASGGGEPVPASAGAIAAAGETVGSRRSGEAGPAGRAAFMSRSLRLRRRLSAAPSAERRREILAKLAREGSHRSLTTLMELAYLGPRPTDRKVAVETLARTPGDRGGRYLYQIARAHPTVEIREEAIAGIGKVASEWTVPWLVTLVNSDQKPGLRHHALDVLAHVRRPAADRSLLQLARAHPDPEIRKEALYWLVHRGDDVALARFIDAA